MLELRPNCECCDANLPPASDAARICTFEHTFCADCADLRFGETCPDCGGGLVARPIRPEGQLHRYPASLRRVYRGQRPAWVQPERPSGWA
ncbi:DUF1272 domain-containing protein [Caulobacter sp.]|uniref:DUF1272 domain-containing protein n=1 Tax=Caulobacter sp. TaxID=78 RepID=UPI002B494CEE|nr:DUF1272 domain-containing protein [Caulobacter sp.]HJV40323.1 DUF1272 domain-containing protein [Caulobacter sp.]